MICFLTGVLATMMVDGYVLEVILMMVGHSAIAVHLYILDIAAQVVVL